ncbi:MAG: hypothetical protein CMF42_01410 [Legionellales bacterium]|nr:hypothetical protein [Legionellales bacterium]|tara:strand:- start:9077 stop:9262 length:186 start_codon:yes stop_codon:yes gene_type:complete
MADKKRIPYSYDELNNMLDNKLFNKKSNIDFLLDEPIKGSELLDYRQVLNYSLEDTYQIFF